jgi:hypothetical protein
MGILKGARIDKTGLGFVKPEEDHWNLEWSEDQSN